MSSKIKVDNITDQGGNELIKRCGSTTTIGSGASNTINVCGSAITLGRCGGTVSLASGATQSGFGREGSVNWQTGSIKTSTFTAVNGEGYFVDTSSGGVTMNLPAGAAGAIVSVADYTRTFQTNNLIVSPNGSEKIGGVNANFTASTEGQALTFVYVDGTEGWINVSDSTGQAGAIDYICASGGNTVADCGNFKVHTFTSPGTFTVNKISTACAARNTVGYLVVAGGGAGGNNHGGGGGAGGYREGRNVPVDNFTASPLVADAPTNAVTVSEQAYSIQVGGGGTAPGNNGAPANGTPSIFSTITAAGGGYGPGGSGDGGPGGSGGGAGGQGGPAGGTGNTPPTTPAQGRNGGRALNPDAGAGGGGGAGNGGGDGDPRCGPGGPGGNGVASSITGSPVTRAGGGGGGNGGSPPPGIGGTGGSGGGGNGGGTTFDSSNGTDNTGGGGGGGSNPAIGTGTTARNGGSGIVIIRYRFQ